MRSTPTTRRERSDSAPVDESPTQLPPREHTARTESLFLAVEDAPTERERRRLRDLIVLENRHLVRQVASRYRNRGQELDDVIQVGAVGLVSAVHRFRLDRGRPFAAFAIPTISGEIKRYFRDTTWMVRPPRRLQELQADVRTTETELTQALHRLPSSAELTTALQISDAELDQARQASSGFMIQSLDAPLMVGADTAWGEVVRDARDDFAHAEAVMLLQPALDRLDDRARTVLHMRFVEGASQEQIGAAVGVSQMQVSRILNRLLTDLREAITPETTPPRSRSRRAGAPSADRSPAVA